MASPPGFPRSLLGEPWSARLAYFQRYTVAHPQLMDAKERLVAALQNAEPNSLVSVFGPTGVGKPTLRLKAEQILTAQLREPLEQDRGRLAVVSVEAVAPESGSFSWRDYFKQLLQEIDEPLIKYKRELQTESVAQRSASRPKPTAGDYRYGVEQALRFRRPAAVMIDEAQHLAKIASGRRLLDQLDAQQLPLAEMPDLANDWEFLYERSIGCVGVLKQWLVRSLSAVLRQGEATLSRRIPESPALSVSQIHKILSEASEGEMRSTDSMEAASRLRERLGLGSHAGKQTAADRSTQAEPTPAPRTSRRPGQRRPVRDIIGSQGGLEAASV